MAAKIVARFAGMTVYEEAEALVYTVPEAEVCRLRKPGLPVEQPDPQRWPKGFITDLRAALNDPLAEQVLAAGEADFASVARLLPPLRDLAFLGDETTIERLEVTPEGAVVGREELACPVEGSLAGAGLLDDWLPVLVHRYDGASGPRELLQFATAGEGGRLDLWRRCKSGAGFGASFAYTCNTGTVPAEEFYARLLALVQHWTKFRKQGLKVAFPEAELETAVRGMLVLGVLTFRGVLSRYGVGCYDRTDADSFPPAIIFLVQALLAWGHTDRARELLDTYLSRYGKADGTLDYYGPAVAEYGQLLALAAEVCRLAGGEAWLRPRLPLLRPIWQRLLHLRAESLAKYPAGDARRGLIPGLPEADYHSTPGEWESFYYSGDLWAVRGLLEIGRVMQRASDPGLHAEGLALVHEAEGYREDVLVSVAASLGAGGAYVPPGPEQQEPIERFTPERHPSYCNYRYLLEMLSAGVLPLDLVGKVVAWRRSHGGELLAGTRFEQQMDDWPALHYARGLLETDDVDHYLLLMYGHWAHHCSQGTLSSYEQVRIEPDEFGTRRMVAGQVVPCQVMVPTMLRWGLLYEEREADVLWLCRAIPRRWLAPGEQVALRGVPTRFGKVSFSLRVAESGSVLVKLRLPDRGCAAEIRLRLRTPAGEPIVSASADGQPVPVEGDVVCLPAGLKGKVKLEVAFARAE